MALRDDRNSEALAMARRGIAWEKGNPFLYSYLGEALHFLTLERTRSRGARNLHKDALEAYAHGLKLFPHDTGLLLKQAQVLDLLGRYPEARKTFTACSKSIRCLKTFTPSTAFTGKCSGEYYHGGALLSPGL